jgi:hypothetical protein
VVACPNTDRGCFWARTRDRLPTHLERTCKHVVKPCRHGCGLQLAGKALRTHEEDCARGKGRLGRSNNEIRISPPPSKAEPVAIVSSVTGEAAEVLAELEGLWRQKKMAEKSLRETLRQSQKEVEVLREETELLRNEVRQGLEKVRDNYYYYYYFVLFCFCFLIRFVFRKSGDRRSWSKPSSRTWS